jgi:hypothetical protein
MLYTLFEIPHSDDSESGDLKNIFCLSPIGRWLAGIKMTDYEKLLVSSGFDDIAFLVSSDRRRGKGNKQFGVK